MRRHWDEAHTHVLIQCSQRVRSSCEESTEHCVRGNSGVYYRWFVNQKGKCRAGLEAGRLFADREAYSFVFCCQFGVCVRGRRVMTCKSVSLSSAMILLCFSTMAAAQGASSSAQAPPPVPQSAPAAQAPAPAAEPPAKLVLKEGTDVKLKFAQDLRSLPRT